MDFFEHQAKANKASTLLIVGYLFALIVIAVGFNLVGLIVWASTTDPWSGQNDAPHSLFGLLSLWLDSRYCWQVSASVLIFIGIISIINWLSLRQGGSKVAKMMGGRPIPSQTLDTNEKVLLNVVEEMAIASGVPTPALFVMDQEQSINAFAAGYSANEAAICVTRGLLVHLSRDELQGVIAHEFSHILNGDMRINIRIISIMYGLIATGQLGRWMMESSLRGTSYSRNSPIVLLPPGFLIWLVGSLGILCSRVMKAAISRQREFLADASAVQFTRQADGISSALYKISQHHAGSNLVSSHAEDLSHMCIAKTLNVRFASLFDTHPPIEDRINRLSPHFLTRAKLNRAQKTRQSQVQPEAQQQAQAQQQNEVPNTETPSSTQSHSARDEAIDYIPPTQPSNTLASQSFSSESIHPNDALYNQPLQTEEMIEFRTQHHDAQIELALDNIGTTDQTNLDAARLYLSGISEEILTALHQPDYASLITLLLLIEANSTPDIAYDVLKEHPPEYLRHTTETLLAHYQPVVQTLAEQPIYPLIQIALNSLKQLDKPQQQALLSSAKRILVSDKKIQPSELLIYLVLFRHLKPNASQRQAIEFQTFSHIEKELITLMTFFVQFTDEAYRTEALERELSFFSIQVMPSQVSLKVSHDDLATAIFRLEHLAPLLKKNVLASLLDLIQHDGKITTEELDWLRMLADCWDTPIPFALGFSPTARDIE